jgi:DNA replicative helicase MCM subunit Mcm2 (Cdc46/Mcm family)
LHLFASLSAESSTQISIEEQSIHAFIAQHLPSSEEFIGPHHPQFNDRHPLSTEKYRTELAGELESIPEDIQREIIQTTVSEISVFFDIRSNKHRLTVTFSENVSQCLRAIEQATHQLTAESFGSSCESFNFTDHSHRTFGNSLRSQSQSEKDQSSLVDDGGVSARASIRHPTMRPGENHCRRCWK